LPIISFLRRFFNSTSVTPNAMSAAKVKAQQIIDENPVAVFSKSYCPYCMRAKHLLSSLNQNAQTLELDKENDGPAIQSYLAKRAGASSVTVPQIYIKSQLIGGCSELTALHKAGKLEPMLA